MESKLFQLLPSKSHSLFIPINKNTLPLKTADNLFLKPRRRTPSLVLNSTNDTGSSTEDNPPLPPPPETVEIRFKRRSKRKNKQMKADGAAKVTATKPPKKWEDMDLTEKALELYVGEKGALFWLNKFAYASIFIMIGGWIAFRFVGPALNLYQLDTPPLPPSAIFKDS
ncbi:hypothetical protein M5689_014027 [Euphorbia peplus]|nr:hypothetical protein M5689_014027 [Euphorbia peplus]